MTPERFLDSLASLRFRDTFNPYRDACIEHDFADAPLIRRRNMRLVLEAAVAHEVDSIWVARDLGYRGGRRTGLALTDEAHLTAHAGLYGQLPLAKATRGPAMAERTAKVVWGALRALNCPVFLWNVFPLHPHLPDDPLSNRCHTRAEREATAHLLLWLIGFLRPTRIVAIGNDAAAALAEMDVAARTVRHPSYGGHRDFLTGISAVYGLVPSLQVDQQMQPPCR